MSWPALQNKSSACVQQNNEARWETRSHCAAWRAHGQVADQPSTHVVVRQTKFMLRRRVDMSLSRFKKLYCGEVEKVLPSRSTVVTDSWQMYVVGLDRWSYLQSWFARINEAENGVCAAKHNAAVRSWHCGDSCDGILPIHGFIRADLLAWGQNTVSKVVRKEQSFRSFHLIVMSSCEPQTILWKQSDKKE